MPCAEEWPAASAEARLETEDGVSVLTYNRLDAQEIMLSVGDDQAGATALFIGTTRNSFKGEAISNERISVGVVTNISG